MRIIFLALFILAMAGASVAGAQDVRTPRDVIDAQLQAFQADDFETGFGFASPYIRSLFGSVGNFERMVTRDYPMVHRPQSVRYLDQSQRNGLTVQRVLITDQQNRLFLLEYELVGTADEMQINGVRILPSGLGA